MPQADVRDHEALDLIVAEAVDEFSHLDIVVANAGVVDPAMVTEKTDLQWHTGVDVVLTGAWQTAKAAVPAMIEAGRGGSIIFISSLMGLKGAPGMAAYASAKFAMIGLAQSLAGEVAAHSVRVNTIHPANVDTDMIQNDLRPTPSSARDRLHPPSGSASPRDLDRCRPQRCRHLPAQAAWRVNAPGLGRLR